MARNGHSHAHTHSHTDGHSHSHSEAHSHAHDHGHGHDHHHHGHHPHPPGHNAPGARQWQTPHLAPDHHHASETAAEPDLDLVERAFVDAFPKAPDPTSFLRLAGIPFTGRDADGKTLNLLRVETEFATDIGALTPHLGGTTFRYDPLPAKLTSQRSTLAFVYFNGAETVRLPLAAAKALRPIET